MAAGAAPTRQKVSRPNKKRPLSADPYHQKTECAPIEYQLPGQTKSDAAGEPHQKPVAKTPPANNNPSQPARLTSPGDGYPVPPEKIRCEHTPAHSAPAPEWD